MKKEKIRIFRLSSLEMIGDPKSSPHLRDLKREVKRVTKLLLRKNLNILLQAPNKPQKRPNSS